MKTLLITLILSLNALYAQNRELFLHVHDSIEIRYLAHQKALEEPRVELFCGTVLAITMGYWAYTLGSYWYTVPLATFGLALDIHGLIRYIKVNRSFTHRKYY
jgi:hypothetical protein